MAALLRLPLILLFLGLLASVAVASNAAASDMGIRVDQLPWAAVAIAATAITGLLSAAFGVRMGLAVHGVKLETLREIVSDNRRQIDLLRDSMHEQKVHCATQHVKHSYRTQAEGD